MGRSIFGEKITTCPATFVFIHEPISDSVMKALGQSRRLRQESDLTEQAWRVLQESRELIREMQTHAANLEQLIKRRDETLEAVCGFLRD